MSAEFRLTERNSDYWTALEQQARNLVASQNLALRVAFGIERPGLVRMVVGTDPNELSPSVRLTSEATVEVRFPLGYFVWLDEAAKWMNQDVPYRGELNLCRVAPASDHSKFFHFIWAHWIVLHEIGHVVCGHLSFLGKKNFSELEAVPATADGSRVSDDLRQAMEIDADVWAAQVMFASFARMTIKGYWDDLYHTKDAAVYSLHDLALIFMPAFLEFDHMAPDTLRTHPTAFERLIVLMTFGGSAYYKAIGEPAREHWSAFNDGLKSAILRTAHMKDSMIYKNRPPVDLVKRWRCLVDARIAEFRTHPMKDDWLVRALDNRDHGSE